jgi:ubiquinone biosynthesis protein Coq4
MYCKKSEKSCHECDLKKLHQLPSLIIGVLYDCAVLEINFNDNRKSI